MNGAEVGRIRDGEIEKYQEIACSSVTDFWEITEQGIGCYYCFLEGPKQLFSDLTWCHPTWPGVMGGKLSKNICKFIYHCPCNPNFHICLNINKEYMLIISGWIINKVNLKAVTVRASEMLSYQSWELHFNLFFLISKELGTCVKIVFGWKT